MQDKIRRFMQGRYGVDSYSRFLLYVGVILAVISMLGKWRIVYGLAWILLIYSYFRVFSRHYAKRAAENQKYLKITYTLQNKFKRRGIRDRQHRIYKCPQCKQRIRIPRGHGKVEIRCPKCGKTFVRKS